MLTSDWHNNSGAMNMHAILDLGPKIGAVQGHRFIYPVNVALYSSCMGVLSIGTARSVRNSVPRWIPKRRLDYFGRRE